MAEVLILKQDADQRNVFGLASVSILPDDSGHLYQDSQGDVIPPSVLEEAIHEYVSESRVGKTMHEGEPTATLIEAAVFTPEKLTALLKGLGFAEVNMGDVDFCAAWVGFHVTDDATWARVKSGELKAFSIGGRATRREVQS